MQYFVDNMMLLSTRPHQIHDEFHRKNQRLFGLNFIEFSLTVNSSIIYAFFGDAMRQYVIHLLFAVHRMADTKAHQATEANIRRYATID